MSLNPPDLRQDARPMTHIELLDLDRLPEHLLVIGGGYPVRTQPAESAGLGGPY